MRTSLIALAVLATVTACGSGSSASVPTAPPSGPAGTASGAAKGAPSVGYSEQRLGQIRAASRCVREHGVPNYQDGVLTADGHVYTDSRSIQDALGKDPGLVEARAAGGLRPALHRRRVRARRRVAGPARARPGRRPVVALPPHSRTAGDGDPDSSTPFTPGHGFGLTSDELPGGGRLGKTDPTLQQAFQACRSELDAEIRASTLAELAHA